MTTNRSEPLLQWRNYIWISLSILCFLRKIGAVDNRVESLASVLREVTGQLERFNSLYINKLERDLSSTSSRISAMEATLRAVADRAHAWDNIQNHMTVWTDQTRTMERKLDILNRCHEKQAAWESKLSAVDALNHKLTALDNKINAMTRLEFKVEKVSERVEEIDSKINYLRERASSVPYGEQPGLAQLANRGLVSYLTTIETKLDNITRKMDKLQHHHHNNNHHNQPPPRIYGARTRGSITLSDARIPERKDKTKEVTGCFMNAHDSQMMEDVSAKVDLLFDRLTDPDYDYNSFVGNFKRQAPSSDAPSHSHSDFDSTPEHVFAKFWKSLFSPFKKMNRKFRSIETQLNDIQRSCNGSSNVVANTNPSVPGNTFGKILDDRLTTLEDALREEMSETRVAVSDQSSHLEKVAQMVSNSAYASEKLKSEVTHQFEAQRAVHQSRFQELSSLILQYCTREPGVSYPPRAPAPIPPTTATITSTTTPTPRMTVGNELPTFDTEGPTITAIRPAYARPTNYAAKCLPKDSPLWKLPNVAQSITVCPIGTGDHHRYDYRVQYSPGHSNSASKRTYRKSKNIVRTYGRKKLTKRSLALNSSIETVGDSATIARVNDFHSLPENDCSELRGSDQSRVYLLGNVRDYNEADRDYYTRYCDQTTEGGGWTVIQRRGMFGNPYLNFTKPWVDYKNGFGFLEREFWWGNDFLHRMSSEQQLTIRFELWDFDDNYAFAEYSNFRIEPEENKYRLSVSGYRGNASDSFSAHNGFHFSTYDRDNDEAPECCPCAPAYGGGWWFFSCFESNLNGEYHLAPHDNDYYRGLIWELWLGDYSLKATEIKIRPSNYSDYIFPTPFPDQYTTDNINLTPELP